MGDAAIVSREASADRPVHHDVVILGGGPAGSATAIRLARLGLDVALVEQARFPRPHVGLCIADQTLALLEFLGLGDDFRAAHFWRRTLTAVRWGGADLRYAEQSGFHVDRARLDRLLIDQARQVGAAIYQPARADRLERCGDDGWRCMLTHDGQVVPLSCAFLVDAAGRRAALPGPRMKDGPPLLALHAEWSLAQPARFDGLIEAGVNAWTWFAQTRAERAMVSIFVDPAEGRSGGRDKLRATYARLLMQFPNLRDALSGEVHGHVHACDASSSHAADPVGYRSIRVGDAAISIDPLSSQGVHLALQSGIQAAIISNTILRRPDKAEIARRFYRDRIDERVAQFTNRTLGEYARGVEHSPGPFWQQRAGDAQRPANQAPQLRRDGMPHDTAAAMTVAQDVVFCCGPIIEGDFVEERMMLRHAAIERPTAFIDGIDVGALFSCLPERFVRQDLARLWRDRLDAAAVDRVANWLWQRGVMVEANPEPCSTA